MTEPAISVIMPAYNSGNYIEEAIESILSQSFDNFEFIIINDGSTDDTEARILSFSDARIRYFKHENNLGNNISRTEGLSLAKGKYIAIMDSDDIAIPRRLQLQYEYLEEHWETEILGGGVQWFGEDDGKKEFPPFENDYIKAALLFKNRLFQPTIMMRRDSILRYGLKWFPEWENMGDYQLWYQASRKGLHIENLKKILVKYRKSGSQIGSRNIDDRVQKLKKSLILRLNDMGLNFEEAEIDMLFKLIRSRIQIDTAGFKQLCMLLDRIQEANNKKKIFNVSAFKSALLFYRMKLGKYYYIENRKNYMAFISFSIRLFFATGYRAALMCYKNENIIPLRKMAVIKTNK